MKSGDVGDTKRRQKVKVFCPWGEKACVSESRGIYIFLCKLQGIYSISLQCIRFLRIFCVLRSLSLIPRGDMNSFWAKRML